MQGKIDEVHCVCGVFHSFAHARLCQLSFCLGYKTEWARRILKYNERLYSETNPLAGSVRNMSKYARRERKHLQISSTTAVPGTVEF